MTINWVVEDYTCFFLVKYGKKLHHPLMSSINSTRTFEHIHRKIEYGRYNSCCNYCMFVVYS